MKHIAFERGSVNQIGLHVLPTDQFKTFSISVFIGQPLDEQTVTPTALVPFVLRRGTKTYPETKQFRERLDDLYGAGFGFDIYKRGEHQIVQLRMDIVGDRFVSESSSLLAQALDFVGDALTNPLLEDGRFRSKYVDAEKETLKKRLESIINDKIKYAAERCIEEMCRHEPYRLNPLGKIGDLPQISPESLYDHYRRWITTAPIDLYVVGDTTLEEVKPLVESSFKVKRDQAAAYRTAAVNREVEQTRTVVEKLDVNQGKLNMGLRTNVSYADDAYPAALMYNGILGGYPHSKLFVNVREKASLAYYASSRLDGHKGILTIQSGIEIDNYEKAVDIINKQLDAIRSGDITDLEMSQTKAMIANQLRELQDSAFEIISLDFNSILSGRERTVQGLIEAIQQVDRAAIQQVAEQTKLDTIYFLRDRKGE